MKTSTQILLVFTNTNPRHFKGLCFQNSSENPKDYAQGGAMRCCFAIFHGEAMSPLGSPNARLRCGVVSGKWCNASCPLCIRNPKTMFQQYFKTVSVKQVVQFLFILLLVPDTSHWPWINSCASHLSELRTTTSQGNRAVSLSAAQRAWLCLCLLPVPPSSSPSSPVTHSPPSPLQAFFRQSETQLRWCWNPATLHILLWAHSNLKTTSNRA